MVWTQHFGVSVFMPEDFLSTSCGLCGTANNEESDGWTLGPSKLCKGAPSSGDPGDKVNNHCNLPSHCADEM